MSRVTKPTSHHSQMYSTKLELLSAKLKYSKTEDKQYFSTNSKMLKELQLKSRTQHHYQVTTPRNKSQLETITQLQFATILIYKFSITPPLQIIQQS